MHTDYHSPKAGGPKNQTELKLVHSEIPSSLELLDGAHEP
jgi:hypothetical protein